MPFFGIKIPTTKHEIMQHAIYGSALLTVLTVQYPYCLMSASVDLLIMRRHSHALAAKQPRRRSNGLQSVVSNAGEGLQMANQGRLHIS